MITQVLFIIIACFLVISGIDYLLGNKIGIGREFKKGIETTGTLALNMIGIYLLAPLLAEGLIKMLEPVAHLFGIDPSIIPTAFLAVDMGGLQLGRELAYSVEMGSFSGILLASHFGATLSFSMPVALAMIKKEDLPVFLKGLVIALIVMPIGTFVGGCIQGVNIKLLIINSIPLFILSGLLGYFTLKHTSRTIVCFQGFSRLITLFSIGGLIVVGVQVITGISFLPTSIPSLGEASEVVVKIGIFLAGAYPMLWFLKRLLKKGLVPVARFLDVNEITLVGMIGALASNLLTFGDLDQMNEKGKMMASAFGISAGFMLGGQLAFVSGMEVHMVVPFLVSKTLNGILSILIVCLLDKFIKI